MTEKIHSIIQLIKTTQSPNLKTEMYDIPLTNSIVLQLRSLMVKTTSPASVIITSWMFMAYLRPWLANWMRPLLMIISPFRVHEGSSLMSCDRVHSKQQYSPSRTETVRKRLTMVMCRSTKKSVRITRNLMSVR